MFLSITLYSCLCKSSWHVIVLPWENIYPCSLTLCWPTWFALARSIWRDMMHTVCLPASLFFPLFNQKEMPHTGAALSSWVPETWNERKWNRTCAVQNSKMTPWPLSPDVAPVICSGTRQKGFWGSHESLWSIDFKTWRLSRWTRPDHSDLLTAETFFWDRRRGNLGY